MISSLPIVAVVLGMTLVSGLTLAICWLVSLVSELGGPAAAAGRLRELLGSGSLRRDPLQLLRQLNDPH